MAGDHIGSSLLSAGVIVDETTRFRAAVVLPHADILVIWTFSALGTKLRRMSINCFRR